MGQKNIILFIFLTILKGSGLYGQFSLAFRIENEPLGWYTMQAIGDMNNDGKYDIILASEYKITVILNDDEQRFDEIYHTNVNLNDCNDMVVADMNGDGFNDLVFSKINYSNFGVLVTNSQRFGFPPPPQPYFFGSVITHLNDNLDFTAHKTITNNLGVISALRCEDIFGDSAPEVLVSTSTYYTINDNGEIEDRIYDTIPDKVTCFFNHQFSDTTYSDELILTSGYKASSSLNVYDFDNNGLSDILYFNEMSLTPQWISQIQAGEFVEMDDVFSTNYPLNYFECADLNNDGTKDFVYFRKLNEYASEISVRESDGIGSFSTPIVCIDTTYSTNNDVRIYDVDLDGDLDLTVRESLSFYIDFYENSDNGEFLEPIKLVKASPYYYSGYLLANFNANEQVDVLNFSNSFVKINFDVPQLNQEIRQINPQKFPNIYNALPFDYNQDGLPDIVASTLIGASLIWFENLGEMNFADFRIIDDSLRSESILRSVDFNEDGIQDLSVFNRTMNSLTLFEGNPQGGLDREADYYIPSYGGFHRFYFVDLDNDGRRELIFASSYSGIILHIYWNSTNLDFQTSTFSINSSTGSSNFIPIDWDNDGLPDLVFKKDSTLSWKKNLGNRSFASTDTLFEQAPHRIFECFYDFDNDGNNDLFIETIEEQGNEELYSIQCILNQDGNDYSIIPLQESNQSSTDYIRLIDLNNDSFKDLISVNSSSPNMLGYSIYAGEFFNNQLTIDAPEFSQQTFHLADFNSDYQDDILTWSSGRLVINYNTFQNLVTEFNTPVIAANYSIFPNPAQNKVLINAELNTEIIDVKVYSIDGRLMISEFNPATKELALDANINQGLYLVHIIDKQGATTIELMKK